MDRQQQRLYGPADPRTAGRLSEPLSGQERFWVVLPLLAGHRAVGALSMAFGGERRDIIAGQGPLTAPATAVGQAVERTRTDEVRHALLPPCCPSRPGW